MAERHTSCNRRHHGTPIFLPVARVLGTFLTHLPPSLVANPFHTDSRLSCSLKFFGTPLCAGVVSVSHFLCLLSPGLNNVAACTCNVDGWNNAATGADVHGDEEHF